MMQLVIFDCDGVLVDSEPISCRIETDYLTEVGFPTSRDDLMRHYVGISLASMMAAVEREHGRALPPDFAATALARTLAAFETELQPVAGMAALLARLRTPRCVASSSEPERIRRSLQLTGLLPLLAPHLFSATMVARGKPAPDLFLHAAAAMGAAPADCLVVEDSIAGVQAATAAGMTALGFCAGGHCRPGHAARLQAAGAVRSAASADALAQALAALGARLA